MHSTLQHVSMKHAYFSTPVQGCFEKYHVWPLPGGSCGRSPSLFGEVFKSLSCKCHAGSWEALAEAICVAELDTRSDAAPLAAAEGCPNRAMSALAARLTASVDFRRRLFHMASTVQLPEETLGACCLPNSYPCIPLGTEVFCPETAESVL